ncbi:hypothetical protein CRI93_04080 [Longimonas halophila]|uniref:histidine kinase n=1 Tax=Longimonas halophila TaxID=1469170 RepID=A0A2H3P2A9_9BACT|nr:ATP-binding protein [Longimonas halophila]PEN08302.1 hypothetical protein CRI93_04080 [Longimonas halophila]
MPEASSPFEPEAFEPRATAASTREAVVRQYDLLDSAPKAPLARIVRLAARAADAPFAALSLRTGTARWFKVCVGLDLNERSEPLAMCSQVMETETALMVANAAKHEAFAQTLLVATPPHVRCYAGIPVRVEGYVIGTLCIMDTVARELPQTALHELEELAKVVADLLALRRQAHDQERIQQLQTYQHTILEQIATETPLPEVLANIVSLAEAHSPMARGSVLLYDAEENSMRHSAAPHLPDAYVNAIDGIVVGPTVGSCGAAMHHNAQVVSEDIAHDPRWADYRDLALKHDLRSCWSTPIRNEEGEVLGTFALYYPDTRVPAPAEQQVIDAVVQLARVAITHHRQRTRLRTERERLEMTLYGGDLGSWEYNFTTRTYTVDARWAHMLGYAPDEMKPTLDFFLQRLHPEDRTLFHKAVDAHVEGGRPVIEATLRMRTKAGRVRVVLMRGKVLEWNKDGTPRRAVGTHMDLTETRQTKKALKEQKEILQVIFDHVPAMISFYSMDGSLSMVNRHWQQVMGWSMEEALDHPNILKALFPDDVLRAQARSFLIEAPDAWRDIPVHTRSGAVVDTSWTIVAPMQDLRIAIGIDISGRKRYEQELIAAKEQAEEMSRLKSALLANMSHEIRTPLTSIIGFSEVLLNEALDAPADRFVKLVHKAGERLMRTLNSVLSLSQLEAGTAEITPEAFDLKRQLEGVHAMFRERARENDVQLAFKYPPNPIPVVLDESAVQRVISNLLSNAIKFTDAGGSVTLECSCTDTHVLLIVRDTGIGIGEAFIDQLFAPFQQESTGHHRKYEGSGLGLAITRELVELMHGTIEVDSEQGVGTRFTVRLPRDMHALMGT